MVDQRDITQRILRRCRELGFAMAGVCDARPSDHQHEYRRWIDDGKHGEMSYLARNIEQRLDPRKLMPGARSIICVADRYWTETPTAESAETPVHSLPRATGEGQGGGASVGIAGSPPPQPSPDARGRESQQLLSQPSSRVARYARGDDYHKVMKQRLRTLCDELRAEFPEHTFRACVDTAPVLEREHAQRAGIGSIGKHTLLIERGVGSYLFLGEIITTLPLAASRPAQPDPCGSCTRCIDACPTDAITPWSVDATKCISYLTIEHRSEIAPKFHAAMGDWIFGCDICQEVCPHNQPTERSSRAEIYPAYAPRREGFDLLEVLGWSEDDRRVAFTRSAMKRANLNMMKRNARIAQGNVRSRD